MTATEFLNKLIAQNAVTSSNGLYTLDEDKFQLIWNEKDLFDRAYISTIEITDTEIRFDGRCVGKHCSYPGTIRIKLARFDEKEFTLFVVK